MPFNGPVVPFGAMVEYHPTSAEDQSRRHRFGPKVLPGIFLGYVLSAVRIWKGDMMVALKNWRICTHLISTPEGLNAKEVSAPMKGENCIFPVADGRVKISGKDQDLTFTLIRDRF